MMINKVEIQVLGRTGTFIQVSFSQRNISFIGTQVVSAFPVVESFDKRLESSNLLTVIQWSQLLIRT
jgi:hypothetical protein